jgi:chemotaxis protein CheD
MTSSTEIRVDMARLAVAGGDATLVSPGLGSCVAIVLWNGRTGVGGLAHVMLPGPEFSRGAAEPARFAGTAVPRLLELMAERGADGPITARLVGGASMFRSLLASGGINIGERNVVAARMALEAAGVPVAAEDVGGDHGRSVSLDVRSGRLLVRSVAAGEREL